MVAQAGPPRAHQSSGESMPQPRARLDGRNTPVGEKIEAARDAPVRLVRVDTIEDDANAGSVSRQSRRTEAEEAGLDELPRGHDLGLSLRIARLRHPFGSYTGRDVFESFIPDDDAVSAARLACSPVTRHRDESHARIDCWRSHQQWGGHREQRCQECRAGSRGIPAVATPGRSESAEAMREGCQGGIHRSEVHCQ